ncbi:hypothetical protein PC121_g22588 [Phytophthora cactorum]|nr:hypothetical protein PC120_g24445 [Phytophthora cactorum]KAG3043372.1 hypothetical protein PC121_g22588 [Phytophthora cactorum]KAG4039468.1 hypothetical protein PC123_g24981 [Phytophthora cactorum]
MQLENPPTSVSEGMSLPVMGWMRFPKDLYDGLIEQICILSGLERMKSEAGELRQLHAASTTESEDTLSAKTKKERSDGQSWDSLKASPFYDILREHKDVLPDEIRAELPQDKGTKYCVTRQWSLPHHLVKAIDEFFEGRRKSGHNATGGWRIVHAFNKLNDATIPAQTPIPRKNMVLDSMSGSVIYSAIDLTNGFYQILVRQCDIPLTAGSAPNDMLWEWLVMPQGLKNAPANRMMSHVLRLLRYFAPS